MPEPTPVVPVPVPVTPGYKTTEFWLSVVAMILGAVMSSGIVPAAGPWAQALGIAATILAALGYQVTRSQVKTATINQPTVTAVPPAALAQAQAAAAAAVAGSATDMATKAAS